MPPYDKGHEGYSWPFSYLTCYKNVYSSMILLYAPILPVECIRPGIYRLGIIKKMK